MNFWEAYQKMCAGTRSTQGLLLGAVQAFFRGEESAVSPEQAALLRQWAAALDALKAGFDALNQPNDWNPTPFRLKSLPALQTFLSIPDSEIASRADAMYTDLAPDGLEEGEQLRRELRALAILRGLEYDLYQLIDRPPFMTYDLEGELNWKTLFENTINALALRRVLERRQIAWWQPKLAAAAESNISGAVVALRVCNRRLEADDLPA